jgi:hypothetical protein
MPAWSSYSYNSSTAKRQGRHARPVGVRGSTTNKQKEDFMTRYIDYSVKHAIVPVTETALDYVQAIVPDTMRYNTTEAGDCIIDLGNACFESGEILPDWLDAVIAEALSNSVQFLHFVAD